MSCRKTVDFVIPMLAFLSNRGRYYVTVDIYVEIMITDLAKLSGTSDSPTYFGIVTHRVFTSRKVIELKD